MPQRWLKIWGTVGEKTTVCSKSLQLRICWNTVRKINTSNFPSRNRPRISPNDQNLKLLGTNLFLKDLSHLNRKKVFCLLQGWKFLFVSTVLWEMRNTNRPDMFSMLANHPAWIGQVMTVVSKWGINSISYFDYESHLWQLNSSKMSATFNIT